jgi:hypothetical protein
MNQADTICGNKDRSAAGRSRSTRATARMMVFLKMARSSTASCDNLVDAIGVACEAKIDDYEAR